MDRIGLITRKHEVRREMERVRRELENKQNVADSFQNRRRISQLELRLERLMAEEYMLRLAIDRASTTGE